MSLTKRVVQLACGVVFGHEAGEQELVMVDRWRAFPAWSCTKCDKVLGVGVDGFIDVRDEPERRE